MTYPVIYTDNLPERFGGCTNGPVIRIRPKYRGDEGLRQHELTHVKQWFATLGLHSFLYLMRPYRRWAEVQAYRKQMQYPDKNGNKLPIDTAARFLAIHYDLDITVEEAKQFIEGVK